MAKRGKSINLFLMDGEISGRMKCTLANWTGIAYRIPRTEIEKCKDRNDLKQSGVYFLFGTSDSTGQSVVYVGQAGTRKNGEGILNRLLEHKRNPNKDYWTEAVAFTTSNNSFGPTEISYLENQFCNLAVQAKRYEVKNGNDPTPGNLTEEKMCEMDEFIDYAKVVMGALGHKVFEPIAPATDQTADDNSTAITENGSILYLDHKFKNSGKVMASGTQTDDGFVVFKGSQISPEEDNTIPETIKNKRKTVQKDDKWVLQENILFTSPSYAAIFVIGKSANGLTSWKDETGKTLKSLEAGESSVSDQAVDT